MDARQSARIASRGIAARGLWGVKSMALRRLMAILACLALPGCVIIDLGVTNPVPGMSRIAVLPFRNLTSHPDSVTDGRRFAIIYASELQKVPGFEVVPVGVAEVAMLENGLKIGSPEDVHRLAGLLGVDVVVIGAVTDYDPYYPPRVGLQIEWLTPHPWLFYPGVQTEPLARKELLGRFDEERELLRDVEREQNPSRLRRIARKITVRGQSEDPSGSPPAASRPIVQRGAAGPPAHSAVQFDADETYPPPAPLPYDAGPAPFPLDGDDEFSPGYGRRHPPRRGRFPGRPPRDFPDEPAGRATPLPPLQFPSRQREPEAWTEPPDWTAGASPREPLMSYSRFFDGTDGDLVAELRDYVELNGDLRSGDWRGYLQRSDDFIRFVCHRAIVEMLTLHGGEGKRRIVVKLRKYR
jgi:hypothetical protein